MSDLCVYQLFVYSLILVSVQCLSVALFCGVYITHANMSFHAQDMLPQKDEKHCKSESTSLVFIRESVGSLCRDEAKKLISLNGLQLLNMVECFYTI